MTIPFGYYFTRGLRFGIHTTQEAWTSLDRLSTWEWLPPGREIDDASREEALQGLRQALKRSVRKRRKVIIGLDAHEFDAPGYFERAIRLLSKRYITLPGLDPWEAILAIEILDEPEDPNFVLQLYHDHLRAEMRRRDLELKPTLITAGYRQTMRTYPSTWVGLEAYLDPPGPLGSLPLATQREEIRSMVRGRLNVEAPRSAGKPVVVVLQSYDRNGTWENTRSLKLLQLETVREARVKFGERLQALIAFSYGRAGGAQQHRGLAWQHQDMWNNGEFE